MTIHRAVERLARLFAMLGGVVLIAITIITCVSITGRALIPFGLKPVPGDFELVEAGTAFAIFAFLPWCQLNRGHASVDLFTSFMPDGVNRFIDVVAEVLMTIVLIIIAWRLFVGTGDKMRHNETTFILQFPLWWAYAASLSGAFVACIISIYVAAMRIRDFFTRQSDVTLGTGAGH